MLKSLAALAAAGALLCAPTLGVAQSYPQVLGPGGSYINPDATLIFVQACNGGLGGFVGSTYNGAECLMPGSGGGGGGANAAAGTTGATVPSSADYTGFNSGGSLVGVSATTPLPVALSGSTGQDASANKPMLPVVGANFGSTGPYANYVLVATKVANTSRLNVDIENNSGSQIVVVRDDGTAASGAALTNASVFPLGGGTGAGSQGGSWSSTTFKGRIQIYAASSTAQVAVMTE